MKKPAVRTNISVPADIKLRMEERRDEFNWSAIASEAFANALKLRKAKTKTVIIDGVTYTPVGEE